MRNSKINNGLLTALAIAGVTQGTIAKVFDCNQTAVSAKMKKLQLPAYGSKSLETIFLNLTDDEKSWYVNQIQLEGKNVLEYISFLIKEKYSNRNNLNR